MRTHTASVFSSYSVCIGLHSSYLMCALYYCLVGVGVRESILFDCVSRYKLLLGMQIVVECTSDRINDYALVYNNDRNFVRVL